LLKQFAQVTQIDLSLSKVT